MKLFSSAIFIDGFILNLLLIEVILLQVSIMKMLDHPNIVNLVEVIDHQRCDYLYMGTTSLCILDFTEKV